MGFTVKKVNRRVSEVTGSMRDDAWVDMGTKGAYTFTSRARYLISLYMLRVQKQKSRLCNRKPTVYKVSG